jgi:hypothetical protein
VFNWLWYPDNLTAFSTVVIAAFTVVLAIVGYAQARLIRKSIDLARDELVANYRPRLRVRNIVITPTNEANTRELGIFHPNMPVSGQFYVVNVGGSAATITQSRCIVFWNDGGLPMKRPYEGATGDNQVPRIKLEPGQSTLGLFMSEDALDQRANTIGTNVIHALHLFVMGWIEYTDDRQIKRRTSFCREFEKRGGFAEGRFYAVNDPDYEHEE